MSQSKVKDITLSLKTIEHLYTAPEVNPFSETEVELVGEPALVRVVKKLEPGFFRGGGQIRLTILLPPDQITPDLPEQIKAAIQRFCQAKIADNQLQIKRTLWSGLRALPLGLVFLGISMTLSAMFNSQMLTFLSEGLNKLLGEGFVVIGWIVLWNPVQSFVNDWTPFWRANQVYRYIMTMDIHIQPQPTLAENTT